MDFLGEVDLRDFVLGEITVGDEAASTIWDDTLTWHDEDTWSDTDV